MDQAMKVAELIIIIAIAVILVTAIVMSIYKAVKTKLDAGQSASQIVLDTIKEFATNDEIERILKDLFNRIATREFSTAQDYIDYFEYTCALEFYKYVSSNYPYMSELLNTDYCKEVVKKLLKDIGIDEDKLRDKFDKDTAALITEKAEDKSEDYDESDCAAPEDMPEETVPEKEEKENTDDGDPETEEIPKEE